MNDYKKKTLEEIREKPIENNFDDENQSLKSDMKSSITKSKDADQLNTNRSMFSKDSQQGTTPRITTSVNLKKSNEIKNRMIDPISQIASMTKSKAMKQKEIGKSKMFQKSMGNMKDIIKSEIYIDLKNMIDTAVTEHASMVNVTQIQKIPENKTETIKEEMSELKNLITKLTTKEEGIEKKLQELDRNIPRITTDIGLLRTDMQSKASKEDITTVNLTISTLASSKETENIKELLNDKADLNETSEIKIHIETLSESQKKYCLITVYNDKVKEIEDTFKRVFETKVDKNWAKEKFDEFSRIIKERDDDLEKYKENISTKFEYYNKSLKKLEQLIENKAEKDRIFEIYDKIRELVNKEQIKELEDKVFPLMKEVLNKIFNFDEKIEDSKRQMVRFDEIILDKASKYDLKSLEKKIDKCMAKDIYDVHIEKYKEFSENTTKKIINLETIIVNDEKLINNNKIQIDAFTNELEKIKVKQLQVITNDDLSEIREKIDTKADKIEIAQIYDIKSNKVDITALIKSID